MTKQNLRLVLFSIALIAGSNINGNASTPTPLITSEKMDHAMDIQALLQEYIIDNEAVGASVGLIDQGTVNFFSYGKKAVGITEAVSEDTIFEIGSLTKVFTTLALMSMVSSGEVQLDDPIEMYLPGVKVPEIDSKKITLRHLAMHTSGIPRMPDNFKPKNPSNPYEDYSVEDLYEFLNHCVLQKAPGEQFEYSNVGMGLLGHILSLRAGKSYEELISDTILKKMEMKNTAISLTPAMEKEFAQGHHLGLPVEKWSFTESIAGAGALRSNVKDMTCFLAANLGLLNSSVSDLLKQCHQKQSSAAPSLDIGLGWLTSHSNESDIIWHNGGTGGFRSFLGFNPQTQRGIVILSNTTLDWPDEFGFSLLDPNFKKPLVDKALENDAEYLNKFVGSYEVTLSKDLSKQDLQISIFNKQLSCSLAGGEVGMLFPEQFGVFGVKGFPDAKCHFTFDDEGNVSKMQVILSNGVIEWEAIPTKTTEKEHVMQNYTIVQRPSMIVIGIECRTSNNPDAGPQDIPKHWGRFYNENIISQIPNKASKEIIAIYSDYEGDYTKPYSLTIGCPVSSLDEIPDDMVAKIIPASSFAVFRAVGEYPQRLVDTWGTIWQTNLDRAYTADYEFYGDKFVSGTPKEVEVYIALRQEAKK